MDLLSCILAGHIGSTEARSAIIANELFALWFGLWTLFWSGMPESMPKPPKYRSNFPAASVRSRSFTML